MAIPEGYEKLAVVGIAWKGDYASTAAYKAMNAVYYNGSTYVALRDNPTGPPAADNTNWQYLAKGFVAALLSMVTAKDTSGLVGTAGADVGAQALVDAIAKKVATELVSNSTLATQLAGYMAKASIVQTESTRADTVPSSAYLKSVRDALNSNLAGKILPQNTSDDVRIVTPKDATGTNATFFLSKTGKISSQTQKDGTNQNWYDFVTKPDLYAKSLSTDLNSIKTPGTYVQPANAEATTANHYPINLAGFLEVIARTDTDWIMQRYTTYTTANQSFKRTFYQGAWLDWVTN